MNIEILDLDYVVQIYKYRYSEDGWQDLVVSKIPMLDSKDKVYYGEAGFFTRGVCKCHNY